MGMEWISKATTQQLVAFIKTAMYDAASLAGAETYPLGSLAAAKRRTRLVGGIDAYINEAVLALTSLASRAGLPDPEED